jgi:hypothetical protein
MNYTSSTRQSTLECLVQIGLYEGFSLVATSSGEAGRVDLQILH